MTFVFDIGDLYNHHGYIFLGDLASKIWGCTGQMIVG
jgi:hypothetical protein